MFTALDRCWICEGAELTRVHDARFEFEEYRRQDPELAAYTRQHVAIVRCASCGFAQPAALPTLPRFFDRMYDQRWSADWIEREHHASYKDRIFDAVLDALGERLPEGRRRLLDVGAHAGRFITRARARGWQADGLELNPATAAFAARASGGVVHQGNLFTWSPQNSLYDAVTLTDVLEHIPDPRSAMRLVRAALGPGGWLAIKVPNGPAQRFKESARARLRSDYAPTIADNLVHVNHFSARSLALALEREGFGAVRVEVAAPEMPEGRSARAALDRLGRDLTYHTARALPGGTRTPLAFNLQAYARRD
jgi:SAM-dependent methyltransferase